mgnify:FL=1
MSWFNLYKRLYERGDMTKEQLKQAVDVGRITDREYEEITGEPYDA